MTCNLLPAWRYRDGPETRFNKVYTVVKLRKPIIIRFSELKKWRYIGMVTKSMEILILISNDLLTYCRKGEGLVSLNGRDLAFAASVV